MALYSQHIQRQLSLMELGMVTAIVLLLIVVGIHKMRGLMALAEQSSMEATLYNLRQALSMTALSRLIHQDKVGIGQLEYSNPFAIKLRRSGQDDAVVSPLQRMANYLGEINDSEAADIAGGSWYFDVPEASLVYRVNHGGYFRSALPGAERARFQVRLSYTDVNDNGRYDPEQDRFSAIHLRPRESYRWTATVGTDG